MCCTVLLIDKNAQIFHNYRLYIWPEAFDFAFIYSLLADSWPQVMDDIRARTDWAWQPAYNLNEMVKVMIKKIDPSNISEK